MILRVYGPDRMMRVEMVPGESIEDLGKEVSKRVGARVSRVSREKDGPGMSGTIESQGLENGDIVYADYEAVEGKRERKKTKEADGECKHPKGGMCLECMPEEAWKSKAFENRNFISLGAYRDMLDARGEDLEMEGKLERCRRHGANVKCSQCMVKELQLKPQMFRAVDHIEFADRVVVDEIVSKWKASGKQFFAFLVGRYSENKDIPGGTTAEVVEAVYPRQRNFRDGFIILEEKVGEDVQRVLDALGLEVVGMLYTRIGVQERFISGLEVDFIASMQLGHLFVENGVERSSRFVTSVMKGDKSRCEVIEFMVSNQCMEWKRSEVIFPTENPEMLYGDADRVDIAWIEEGERREGPLFPVEYMLVRPTHGFLERAKRLFVGNRKFSRGEGIPGIKKHFRDSFVEEKGVSNVSLACLSNLDVLIELVELGILESKSDVFRAVREGDSAAVVGMVAGGKLEKLVELVKEVGGGGWGCAVCTFHNTGGRDVCEMCGIPKS
jgi:NPL4 family/NPL4 family, putative zinc binding region